LRNALVLSCDDNFIAYTSVVARRIAHNASVKFPIFILSDGVSDENKSLARAFCPQIEFIEASDRFPALELPMGLHFSRASYMRLFLDEMNFDGVVYLDSDLTPLVDVSPLLELAPRGAPMAAAFDLQEIWLGTSPFPIFNGGVAVYDMTAIRSEGLFKEAIKYALENPEKCVLVDQDALNAVLEGRWQVLDWRWNLHGVMSPSTSDRAFIRHFTGPIKPWGSAKLGIERCFVDMWRNDLADSPWKSRFFEQPWRLRHVVEPILKPIEDRLRIALHSGSAGRRGKKARFMQQFPSILEKITSASEQRLTARDAGIQLALQPN
jgi:lipopolysaccharide biosynthesis glycosyltransferase